MLEIVLADVCTGGRACCLNGFTKMMGAFTVEKPTCWVYVYLCCSFWLNLSYIDRTSLRISSNAQSEYFSHGCGLSSATSQRAVATWPIPSGPIHLLPSGLLASTPSQARLFSTSRRLASHSDDGDDPASPVVSPQPAPALRDAETAQPPKLTHLTPSGEAHMVPIAHKAPTARTARAACRVVFSRAAPLALLRANALGKGDVLGVARVAGIMAAKRTPELVPLCHPVMISHVGVELTARGAGQGGEGAAAAAAAEGHGFIEISATVACEGKTGVEMEALTAAGAAALTVYDMCKAVDKGMRIEGLRVVLKEGGKSGRWVEGMRTE